MNLEVRRKTLGPVATLGELWIDGVFECFTLEDKVRPPGIKIFGETAIPEGTYKVEITYSPKFQADMPLLDNVPMFEAVRIHWGNAVSDTDGCILVGQSIVNPEFIGASRAAFESFFPKLEAGLRDGPVQIVISNTQE